MIRINEKVKSDKDLHTSVPCGIMMTFENGNTISIQFGWGNYSTNQRESKPETLTAEVAMWDKNGKWHNFEGSDGMVKGFVNVDEVADLIQYCKNTKF